jgi:hypothetical protein
MSRGSSVGIANGYGLDNRGVGVRVLVESRILTFLCHRNRFWGPLNFIFIVYKGALSLGVKRQGREADHSPLTGAEAENVGAIPPFLHTSSWPCAN